MSSTADTDARTGSLTPGRLYRIVAIAEMVTWTGLLLGMALKYGGVTDAVVPVAGLAHGLTFLSYLFTAVFVGLNQRWSVPLIGLGVLTTFIPYATYPYDRWLERNERLNGSWRPAETGPDAGFVERLRGFLLKHPLLTVLVVVVGIAVVTSFLLWLGPPAGWSTRF
ncbi:DUF3817 domain-containing protein [Propionibacteriaceae bacterium Y1685]|uniref:DUF3817 domain-containing protein n=1 Tax=Microlunatus sp. Y1700 TaxID=3418487 RepID=UPI003B7AC141